MKTFQTTVISLNWERIHLYIRVKADTLLQSECDINFYLVNSKYHVEAKFHIAEHHDSEFLLSLNITNQGHNRCVKDGTYIILAEHISSREYSVAKYYGNHGELQMAGRCFRYAGTEGAYTVNFMVDEYGDTPKFQLLFYDMKKRAGAAGFTWNKLISRHLYLLQYFYNICHWLQRQHRQKHILFLSDQDDKLVNNMAALYSRMEERQLQESFKIDLFLRKKTSKMQIMSSLFMIFKIAGADFIFIDDYVAMLDWIKIPKSTTLIQLWHAGAGFKAIGYSRWGHYGCVRPYCGHRQYTYCTAGSANIAEFFSEQFGISDQQIIPAGMPRMDQYLNVKKRQQATEILYRTFPQITGKQVLLFAPTYRGRNRLKAYYPYEKIDFESLYHFSRENNWIVLFKMHPFVSEPVPIQEGFQDCLIDVTSYPDINTLFYVTNLLVTDYSSCIYEFSLMHKPMLFYAFDKEQYASARGFHRDYDSNVPGKVCLNFSDLMEALQNQDYELEKVAQYIEKNFDYVDDKASDRIIDWLILGHLPTQYRNALELHQKEQTALKELSFEAIHTYIDNPD